LTAPSGGEYVGGVIFTRPPVEPREFCEPSNTDLAMRVGEWRRNLPRTPKPMPREISASERPLIAPSGRIQLDVAKLHPENASQAEFGNVQNPVVISAAPGLPLGWIPDHRLYPRDGFANRGIDATINRPNRRPSRMSIFKCTTCHTVGNVRVGTQECFGLEQLTRQLPTLWSGRSTMKALRARPQQWHHGLQLDRERRASTWAIGAFTNQTGFDQPPLLQAIREGSIWLRGSRILPWIRGQRRTPAFFHTGIDYAFRSGANHTAVFAMADESPSAFDRQHDAVHDQTTALTDVNNC